jgi:hypothetical protein
MVRLLWTSDEPVAEASTYIGQHNIYTQETNIHAPSRIQTRDLSNQAAADVNLRPRGYWDWPIVDYQLIMLLKNSRTPYCFSVFPWERKSILRKLSAICACILSHAVRQILFGTSALELTVSEKQHLAFLN